MRSFMTPFLLTFFVVVVFYVLQFFYTYIDDFVGKGLQWYVVVELIAYLSTNVIPLALPLAILLSAIMAYGSLGEHYELTAMKSAGIPLLRFIRGSIFFTAIFAVASLAFSNYVMPVANLKFYTTLIDITQAKPALDIKENVFFSGINDYVIKIDKKGMDNRKIYGVYIADQSGNQANNDIVVSDSGLMYTSPDRKYLILRLYNGSKYERLDPNEDDIPPYTITHFAELEKVFDLSAFQFTRSSEERLKNHYIMLNLRQLRYYIDSLQNQSQAVAGELLNRMSPHFGFMREEQQAVGSEGIEIPFAWRLNLYPADTARLALTGGTDTTIAHLLPAGRLDASFNRAISYAKSIKDRIRSPTMVRMENYERNIVRAQLEYNRKFMLAASCLVLLFVGASFGAIVRKGGIGFPVIFAIIIYVLSYILLKIGENMATENVVSPFVGIWSGLFIMIPIAVFFTIKAKNDSSFLFLESYIARLAKWRKRLKSIFG